MRVCIVRMGMAVWLAGCICQAICQTDGGPDYVRFFQRVVADKASPGGTARVILNGQPAIIRVPTVQELTGLTDHEMTELQGIAGDCMTRIGALERELLQRNPNVFFDGLIESIQTGKDTSGVAARQLKDFNDERGRIVLAHVLALKAALGDARFQPLDARLRSEEASWPHAAPQRQ
jgi:hypothetical protein